jgi:hypothetical protein
MKKILSFSLFEARYHPHFSKRLKERILDLSRISIDTLKKEEVEAQIEDLVGPKWRELLIDSVIKNTEKRIFEKVKNITFPQNSSFAIPISFLFLDFDGKSYPIEITSLSSKENDGEQSVYKGSQIWVAVTADTALTLKVFDKSKTIDSIASNMKSGSNDRYKKYSFNIENPGNDFRARFSWNPEKNSFDSDDEEEKVVGMDYEAIIPERKTISAGDLVGLIINKISPDDFTYGEIKEITNMGDIKDKQKIGSLSSVEGIKLSFLPSKKEDRIVSNGKEIPFVSTVKPGSRINLNGKEYVVLGPEGGKPLVTSEPSIINAGRVQTWVEEL